jgi:hypothetical protein
MVLSTISVEIVMSLTFEATDFEARSDVARSDSDVAYHVKVQATFIQRVSGWFGPNVTTSTRTVDFKISAVGGKSEGVIISIYISSTEGANQGADGRIYGKNSIANLDIGRCMPK